MAYIKENQAAMGELYSRIGNCLAADLPEGWQRVCLGYFVGKDGQDEMLIYVSMSEDGEWRDFMEDVFASDDIMFGVFDCKDVCQELYQLCAKVGDRFASFTFRMDAGGSFDADFSYDAFDKLEPIHRRMWMGEYLE